MDYQLANYFKERKGLNRLIIKLKDKYLSLSSYSGTIILDDITKEESRDLSNFLGRKIIEGATIKVSYKEINKKLLQTKYNNFDWKNVFDYYFEENVITNKEQRQILKTMEKDFFDNIISNNENNVYIDYFKKIIEDKNDIYKLLKQNYNSNSNKLEKELNYILHLLNNIPNYPTNLAIFSSLTGNPHFLDLNTKTSNLFLKILSYIKNIDYPKNQFDKIKLLEEINIYIDTISNYVITYKLVGNEMLDNFAKNKQILNLNLNNILSFDKITAKEKQVLIFENPSILNTLHECDIPIIITSGMPNISLYKLLDKLIKEGNTLYYNGDFDPEGLIIAQKLKDKYKKLILFCYDDIDYDISKSTEIINNSRLKKLNDINTLELQEIKQLLLKEKKSGFQEKNITRIKEYIEKI